MDPKKIVTDACKMIIAAKGRGADPAEFIGSLVMALVIMHNYQPNSLDHMLNLVEAAFQDFQDLKTALNIDEDKSFDPSMFN